MQARLALEVPAGNDEIELMADGRGVASLDAVNDWVVNAMPGAVCVYARVHRLHTGHVGSARMRVLAEQGLVGLLAQRREGDGQFSYRARRLLAVAPPVAVPPRAASQADDPESECGRVFALLRECARQGKPCPTNQEIARTCQLRDGDQARYRMRLLREDGRILIDRVGMEPGRVVTIAATGRRTGVIG